jgi:hypothetical protein
MKLVDGQYTKVDGWVIPTQTPVLGIAMLMALSRFQLHLRYVPKIIAITTDISILDRALTPIPLVQIAMGGQSWAAQHQGFTREAAVAAIANEQLLATHRSRPLAEVLHAILISHPTTPWRACSHAGDAST